MRRSKIVIGALLVIAGLAAFALHFDRMSAPGSQDTYWLLRNGDLERSAAGLLAIVAGVAILLKVRRR